MKTLRKAAAILFLALTLAGAGMPAPALAQVESMPNITGSTFGTSPTDIFIEAWKWAAEKARYAIEELRLSDIIQGFTDLYELLNSGLKDIEAAFGTEGGAKFSAIAVGSKVEEHIMQAKIDAATLDAMEGEMARMMFDRPPLDANLVCKRALLHAMPLVIEDYQREVSRLIAMLASNVGRGYGADWSGPDFSSKQLKRECDEGRGSKIAGAKDECRNDDLKDESGRLLADAALMPVGYSLYKMPQLAQQTYKDKATGQTMAVVVPAADATSMSEKLWVAAVDHLVWLIGPTPSPPVGKALKTPVGKTQKAMFDHCLARKNALVKPHADWIAYHTRPNCREAVALCEKQETLCKASKGVVDLENDFNGCGMDKSPKRGLSPYEQDELLKSVCKSGQNYISHARASVTEKELLADTVNLCDMLNKSVEGYRDQLRANVRKTAQAWRSIDRCWRGVAALGGGGS